PNGTDSSEKPSQPVPFGRRRSEIRDGSAALPSCGIHAVGRNGVDELLTVHLRVQRRKHRDNRRWNTRWPGGRRSLVELANQSSRSSAAFDGFWNERNSSQRTRFW